MILLPLAIKVAFLYEDTRRVDYVKPSIHPTYRVSLQVYPKLKAPHFSAALSDVDRFGIIKPLVLVRSKDLL
jgi:hypothetical protein